MAPTVVAPPIPAPSAPAAPAPPLPTRNDTLPPPGRAAVCAMLDALLADAIDLAYQVRSAHWNVRGPQFIALHRLLDEVYDAVDGYVDTLAERIGQFGGIAHGTVPTVAARTRLPAGALEVAPARAHVAAVAQVLAAFGKSLREAVAALLGMADQGSANLLIDMGNGVDKHLWLVESHLVGE